MDYKAVDPKFSYVVDMLLEREVFLQSDINLFEDDTSEYEEYAECGSNTMHIEEITRRELIDIFYEEYWAHEKYCDIDNLATVTQIFALVVNLGPYWAHRLAQRALIRIGHQLEEDGILSPKTIEIINKSDIAKFIIALQEETASYYSHIFSSHPMRDELFSYWAMRTYH